MESNIAVLTDLGEEMDIVDYGNVAAYKDVEESDVVEEDGSVVRLRSCRLHC